VVDRNPGVRFLAVGHGPLEKEIRDLHGALALGDRFLLVGYRSDALRVLAACDIFILASHHEGYPIVVMEALTVGLPVVTTSVGDVRELIQHGREGLIVPPRDYQRLAEAVEEVVRDPERRDAMAAAASRHVTAFDISQAGRRIEAIYKDLANGQARSTSAAEQFSRGAPPTLGRRRPLRAVFFVQFPTGRSPGQRFRVEQWLHLLPPGMIDADIRPIFPDGAYERLYRRGGTGRKAADSLIGVTNRLFDSLTSRGFDVAFIYLGAFQLGPPVFESVIARRVPFVYDFDDAIFLQASNEVNPRVGWLKRPGKVAKIVHAAAATTVGNDFLASYAGQYSRNVHVLPTTLDIDHYRPGSAAKRPNDRLRIGWSGSFTTATHLHTIDGALATVLKSRHSELFVLGVPDFQISGVKNSVSQAWRLETEIPDVSSFDIGLMPLPDTSGSRGKCGFKALLYMSLGIPCIASPVGVNSSIIQDGENGLLASTETEWVEAISRLADDPALRKRLGEAGRVTVVERFSGQRWAPRFLEVLREAAECRATGCG
jgi:glycosyltransferase involved in cell wall biosynthesis